jgi:hypothetical protein
LVCLFKNYDKKANTHEVKDQIKPKKKKLVDQQEKASWEERGVCREHKILLLYSKGDLLGCKPSKIHPIQNLAD